MKNKILCVLAVFLSLFSVLPFSATANGAVEKPSLTIEYIEDGTPLDGALFELYYVAADNGKGGFSPVGDFAKYPVSINTSEAASLRETALALKGFVRRDSVKPLDAGQTNGRGIVEFPTSLESLEKGLYLVIGEAYENNGFVYSAEPVLVPIPCFDSATETEGCHPVVKPKFEKSELSDTTVPLNVVKVWKNDRGISRPESVTVELIKNGTVHETVTLNEKNGWRYEWNELPTVDENGKPVEWSIVEKDTAKDYVVSVSRDGYSVTLTNTYTPDEDTDETTSRTVKKQWNDKGYENKRPVSVVVELLKNGAVFDTVELSEKNDWSHTWSELDRFDGENEIITWSIREKEVRDYTPSTELNGYTFILTNSYDKPKIPRTGLPWQPVLVLASGGTLLVLVGVLLRKKSKNESK